MGTLSPNKGYPVPTVNGDVGIWGPEIQSMIGIVDTNLGGSQSINVAGNSNVTATSTQAQCLYTKFTGALTGNIQYILPALGGIFLFNNTTTGSYTLSVITTAAGASVSVPQGLGPVLLFCDGINFASTSSTFGSGIVLPNNESISSYDTSNALHSMLSYNSLNVVTLSGGTAGFVIENSAGTQNNLILDNLGNATFAKSVTATGLNSNGFNLTFGSASYYSGWRNDGNYTFLLLTGSSGGAFNSLRPFYVTNATGAVTIDATGVGTTFGGQATFGGQIASIGSTLTIGSSVAVTGTTTLGNNTGITGNLSVSGNLSVTGSLSITGTYQPAGGFLVGSNINPVFNLVNGNQVLSSGAQQIYNGSGTIPLIIGINASGSAASMGFWNGTNVVGSITTTSGNTYYNTSSDARLKIPRRLIIESGRIIDAITALWFNWKSSPDAAQEPGFLAQQLHKVFPWAVRKGSGRPGQKNFMPWQTDPSKLMPIVIAELQELRRRVSELEGA